ncbi:hypothetical protein [Oscillatoria sp. FACHB-1406]|uniref:hypothetical protein n=1 Tax=Oscillatoria sp. FACHB-1406 TaxID=2692846 RepID=UPI001682D8CD|nr:hypothetical protein [Oscillatoria sp. FACHB-1406]MBD2578309.1 hypothetical protein [Oscillatoria sp. FACHB-1406]
MMFPILKKPIAVAGMSGLLLLPLMGLAILESPPRFSALARAEVEAPQLSPISPDESVEETLRDRFSFPSALERLTQIKGALSSFIRLTEKSPELAGIGNTDWETQHLGFFNWTGAIEGTLRHQDYELKKLELELARKQYEDGEISQTALLEKEQTYQRAEQEFKAFWSSFRLGD